MGYKYWPIMVTLQNRRLQINATSLTAHEVYSKTLKETNKQEQIRYLIIYKVIIIIIYDRQQKGPITHIFY